MPATDDFDGRNQSASGPYTDAVAVTPNDSADLARVSRGLWVGTSGDVAVVMRDGGELTLHALAEGVAHPIRVRRVKSSGTTATNIRALY